MQMILAKQDSVNINILDTFMHVHPARLFSILLGVI